MRSVCVCMSACSGEVDCESSFVTHKASAIKAAHFNTLSYGINTHRWAHTEDTHTHTCSVSHSLNFSLNCPFCFKLLQFLLTVSPYVQMSVLFSHTQRTSSMLTPPYVGLGVVADAKTRGTSRYQQSTACLLPLTHHLTALIINHRRTDYSGIKKALRPNYKTYFSPLNASLLFI